MTDPQHSASLCATCAQIIAAENATPCCVNCGSVFHAECRLPGCPCCGKPMAAFEVRTAVDGQESLSSSSTLAARVRRGPNITAIVAMSLFATLLSAIEAAWIFWSASDLAFLDLDDAMMSVLPVTGTTALAVAGGLALSGAFASRAGIRIRAAAIGVVLVVAAVTLLAPVAAERFEGALALRRARFADWLARLPEDVGHEQLAPLGPVLVPTGSDELPPTITLRGGMPLALARDGEMRRGIVVSRSRGVSRIDRLDLDIDSSLRARDPDDVSWIVFVRRNKIDDAYQYGGDSVSVDHVALVLYRIDSWDAVVTAFQQALPPSQTTQWRQRYRLGESTLVSLVERVVEKGHAVRP